MFHRLATPWFDLNTRLTRVMHLFHALHRTMEPLPCLRQVELINLSRDIPHTSYSELCDAMGYSYNWNQSILASHRSNYIEAMREILIKWNTEQADTSQSRMILATKLREVKLGGLGNKLSKGKQKLKCN